MEIKQFEDVNLAHYSYAILSDGEMALVDPSRDPKPYYDFAEKHKAKIVAIIETHPHADFVSGHLEIQQQTGAVILTSKLVQPNYDFQAFDAGDEFTLGKVRLIALNTPGHSPDSISALLKDEHGKDVAVFTGDSLFIGDCGRPDLRENAGPIHAERKDLAEQMYQTMQQVFLPLADEVVVYPAHGAGSLCGKNMSTNKTSTIGEEKKTNWSLKTPDKELFVNTILKDQPYIPKYFPLDVNLNKNGATSFKSNTGQVEYSHFPSEPEALSTLDENTLIIDTRDSSFQCKSRQIFNIKNNLKFETWLGSIVAPSESFYLIGNSEVLLKELVARIAKIGYEKSIKKGLIIPESKLESGFSLEDFSRNQGNYTIVDVRSELESNGKTYFSGALNIPLHTLRERISELPVDKPILVHCAGGYRSAIGASIIKSSLNQTAKVFDLGDRIKSY